MIMNNKVYYKINEEDSQLTEKLLNDNNIEFTKYNDVLKAICDEEAQRMREHHIDIQITDEQTEKLSECLFDTEMDLLNYDVFLEIADRYVDDIKENTDIMSIED